MLMPKKTKFRKIQRGTMAGRPKGKAGVVLFGDFGIKATEPSWVTSQQIESARVAIGRALKKVGKMYLRIFPDKPFTKKPAETRMGKGKGNPEQWVSVVRRGCVLYEIGGVSEEVAKHALAAASYKFPMKTRFIKKDQL